MPGYLLSRSGWETRDTEGTEGWGADQEVGWGSRDGGSPWGSHRPWGPPACQVCSKVKYRGLWNALPVFGSEAAAEPSQRWGPCSQDPSRWARGLTGSKRHEVWEVSRLALLPCSWRPAAHLAPAPGHSDSEGPSPPTRRGALGLDCQTMWFVLSAGSPGVWSLGARQA